MPGFKKRIGELGEKSEASTPQMMKPSQDALQDVKETLRVEFMSTDLSWLQ